MEDFKMFFRCCYENKQLATGADRLHGQCDDCGQVSSVFVFTEQIMDMQDFYYV